MVNFSPFSFNMTLSYSIMILSSVTHEPVYHWNVPHCRFQSVPRLCETFVAPIPNVFETCCCHQTHISLQYIYKNQVDEVKHCFYCFCADLLFRFCTASHGCWNQGGSPGFAEGSRHIRWEVVQKIHKRMQTDGGRNREGGWSWWGLFTANVSPEYWSKCIK